MNKYYITSEHDVYLDSYKDGELTNVNYYTMNSFIIAESVQKAIEKYFETILYYSFDIKLSDSEYDKLFYSVLVDAENTEATKNDIKIWRMGKRKLYSNNITLKISECIQCTNF